MTRYRKWLLCALILICGFCSLATADEVDGIYADLTTCDNHGLRNATEELGDPMVFSPGQQIGHDSQTFLGPACPATDNPNLPESLVTIVNTTGRFWRDLFYVGDPSTVFTNVDGVGDAGVFPDLNGLAFRIDSVGMNRPLIFESMTPDNVFEPGEAWQFIVQDYMSPIGPADSFFSIGFADASVAVVDTSAASIVQFIPIPEPAPIAMMFCSLAAALVTRRRRTA